MSKRIELRCPKYAKVKPNIPFSITTDRFRDALSLPSKITPPQINFLFHA